MLWTLQAIIRVLFGTANAQLPVVCIFGRTGIELSTPIAEEYEEKRLDCRCYASDAHLERILVRDKPHVIVSIGERSSFPRLAAAPFEVRRKWLHFDALPDLAQLGIQAYNCYLDTLFRGPAVEETPLVTVFTPAYKTGERIRRPFQSLREQTYTNWEWIVVDDSDDGGRTFNALKTLAKQDHRVQVFKPWEHSGIIGKVKHWACSLGKGQILVELDHDDELTDYALEATVEAFRQYPQGGFLYSDCAEVYPSGASLTYRDGWAFGYGTYSDVEYRGRLYKAGCGGNINAKTIRHIVSCPNHIRAWRKSVYDSIGGHNAELHVADDYEILVRTFLKTRMIRLPRLCYLQHIGNSAQQARGRDIQRHVKSIREHYDGMIHERLIELGCEDFAWDAARHCSDFSLPNPTVESHATLIAQT